MVIFAHGDIWPQEEIGVVWGIFFCFIITRLVVFWGFFFVGESPPFFCGGVIPTTLLHAPNPP